MKIKISIHGIVASLMILWATAVVIEGDSQKALAIALIGLAAAVVYLAETD